MAGQSLEYRFLTQRASLCRDLNPVPPALEADAWPLDHQGAPRERNRSNEGERVGKSNCITCCFGSGGKNAVTLLATRRLIALSLSACRCLCWFDNSLCCLFLGFQGNRALVIRTNVVVSWLLNVQQIHKLTNLLNSFLTVTGKFPVMRLNLRNVFGACDHNSELTEEMYIPLRPIQRKTRVVVDVSVNWAAGRTWQTKVADRRQVHS